MVAAVVLCIFVLGEIVGFVPAMVWLGFGESSLGYFYTFYVLPALIIFVVMAEMALFFGSRRRQLLLALVGSCVANILLVVGLAAWFVRTTSAAERFGS